MIRIHIAYHHPVVREAIANALAREPDLQVIGRGRAGEEGADDVARGSPAVVVLSQPWGDDIAALVSRYRVASGGAKVVLLCSVGQRGERPESGADAELDVADGTDAIAAAVRAVLSGHA